MTLASRLATRVGSRPGSQLATRPGSRPGTQPGSQPDTRLGSRPGTRPDTQRGTRPGSRHGTRLGRLGLALAGLVVVVATGPGPVAAQEADPSSSVTMFPSQLTVEVQRGEVVDRTIGIVQTGEPQRELRFDVSGDAAPYVSVLDAATRSTPLESVTVSEGTPTYAVVRVAPPAGGPEGRAVARIRLVSVGGSVTVGSELEVAVDVKGTWDFSATLLGAEVLTPAVEVGRALRVRLDVDVRGSAALVPEVKASVAGPDGNVVELVARPPTAQPGGETSLEVQWPTTGWSLGAHQGEIVLSSGSTEVGRAPLNVELVPAGSTTRAVTLLGAQLVSDARAGKVAKVAVTVRNDGTTDGRVVFVGDLLQGTLPIAVARSEPQLVGAGQVAELEVYAQLGDPGTYRLRGRANLDGAESSTVSVDIEATASGGRPWLWPAAAAAGVALVVGLVVLRRRSASRKPRRPSPKNKQRGKGPAPKAASRPSPPGVSVKVRR